MTLDEAQRHNKRPGLLKRTVWSKQVKKLTDESKGGLAPSEMSTEQLAKHQKDMGNLEFIKKGMTGTYGQASKARSTYDKTQKDLAASVKATNKQALTAEYNLGAPSSTPTYSSTMPSMYESKNPFTIKKKTNPY